MGPFDLADNLAYQRWREHKLAHAVTRADELIVEVRNPHAVSAAERMAILACCQRSNMAVYATNIELDESGLQAFSAQFGLRRLDANWLAGESGITRIAVSSRDDQQRQTYIPYTDRPIKWHTDGYYNPPERQIQAMVLHCVRSAGQGGENRVMDHEIAYLMLRDANPDFIRALSAPDVMTIPERVDETDGIRPAQSGPVFSVNAAGQLHMRYTARTRSIVWKPDELTGTAVAQLESVLATPTPHILGVRLEAGMGLLCNNVLHDRSAFVDDPAHPRLLLRGRYLDRVTGLKS